MLLFTLKYIYIVQASYDDTFSYVVAINYVIHHPLDKMDAILANNIFKCIYLNENDRIPIQIPLKFVLSSPIGNKLALVQVMAWRRSGNKPLSESMMA